MPSKKDSPTYEAKNPITKNTKLAQAASSSRVHYVTDVTGSILSATAYITVTAGNTTYWQDVFGTATFLYIKNFTSPIAIPSGSAVSVKVLYGSAGSAYANIAGYTI